MSRRIRPEVYDRGVDDSGEKVGWWFLALLIGLNIWLWLGVALVFMLGA